MSWAWEYNFTDPRLEKVPVAAKECFRNVLGRRQGVGKGKLPLKSMGVAIKYTRLNSFLRQSSLL